MQRLTLEAADDRAEDAHRRRRSPRARRRLVARARVAQASMLQMRAALPPVIRRFSLVGRCRPSSPRSLARVRPVVAVVRIVARPHDVVDTDRLAQLDAGVVGDERRRVVAVPVERRRLVSGRSPHTRLRHQRSSRHSRKCGIQPTPVSIQHTWSSGNRSNTPVKIMSVMLPVGHREHVAHAADRLGARRLARMS